jgi:hypothetical protein
MSVSPHLHLPRLSPKAVRAVKGLASPCTGGACVWDAMTPPLDASVPFARPSASHTTQHILLSVLGSLALYVACGLCVLAWDALFPPDDSSREKLEAPECLASPTPSLPPSSPSKATGANPSFTPTRSSSSGNAGGQRWARAARVRHRHIALRTYPNNPFTDNLSSHCPCSLADPNPFHGPRGEWRGGSAQVLKVLCANHTL